MTRSSCFSPPTPSTGPSTLPSARPCFRPCSRPLDDRGCVLGPDAPGTGAKGAVSASGMRPLGPVRRPTPRAEGHAEGHGARAGRLGAGLLAREAAGLTTPSGTVAS